MTEHAGRRPRILIPARFSATTSALRYGAEVTARALLDAVWAVGGEPLVLHPHAPDGIAEPAEVMSRLDPADGILLPGGGDLAARWTGQAPHPTLYDVDEEQDAFDLAVVRAALARRIPLLAICRGLQVVNAVLGGTVVQDMDQEYGANCHHRHRLHTVKVTPGSVLAGILGESAEVSCYHHQCLARPGAGLEVVAQSADGVIEAVELTQTDGWFLGVQWHPEDTWARTPGQRAVFAALVDAARSTADRA